MTDMHISAAVRAEIMIYALKKRSTTQRATEVEQRLIHNTRVKEKIECTNANIKTHVLTL